MKIFVHRMYFMVAHKGHGKLFCYLTQTFFFRTTTILSCLTCSLTFIAHILSFKFTIDILIQIHGNLYFTSTAHKLFQIQGNPLLTFTAHTLFHTHGNLSFKSPAHILFHIRGNLPFAFMAIFHSHLQHTHCFISVEENLFHVVFRVSEILGCVVLGFL